MTTTKKNGILLTLAAFMLAALSAALIFMIAPNRSAKADETETIDYTRFSVVEIIEEADFSAGMNLNGKILVWGNTSRANISCADYTKTVIIDGSALLTICNAPVDEYEISGSNDSEIIATLSEVSGLSDIMYFFYFSDEIEISSITVDTRDMVIDNVEGGAQNQGYLLSMSQEEPETDYTLTYTLNADGLSYTVSGYTGMPVNVSVPSMYNDLPVTKIGINLFRGCNHIESIIIPDSVIEIGSAAFYTCDNLRSVTMSNNVTEIGPSAFSECHSLTSIVIPEGVTVIMQSSFYGCRSLTSIIIPEGVTNIRKCAFYNCSGLTSVTIPTSITSISELAFWNCSGLTELTIPNNAIIILDDHCLPTTLTTLYVPASAVDDYKNIYSAYASIITAIPDNTGEPQTNEPTEPASNDETDPLPNVTESKFDFGEWLHNAGEDVSAWLGDNVGIATTGSTVLIIGAVIIAVILLRKRR